MFACKIWGFKEASLGKTVAISVLQVVHKIVLTVLPPNVNNIIILRRRGVCQMITVDCTWRGVHTKKLKIIT